MFTYELNEITNSISGQKLTTIIRSDGALIPTDVSNSDYAEYLAYTAWVEAGNEPEEFWSRPGDI